MNFKKTLSTLTFALGLAAVSSGASALPSTPTGIVETPFYAFEVPFGATVSYVSEADYWKTVSLLKHHILAVIPEGFPIPPQLMVGLANFYSPIIKIEQAGVTSYAFSIIPPVPGSGRDTLIKKFFTPDVIGNSASKHEHIKVRLHKESGSGNTVNIILSVGEEHLLREPTMDALSDSFELRVPSSKKYWECVFGPATCR